LKAYIYILFFLSIISIPAIAEKHTIYGIVTDSITGRPIAGAIVFMNKTTFFSYTDSSGKFQLDSVEKFSTSIICYKKDYNLLVYELPEINKNILCKFVCTPTLIKPVVPPDSILNKNINLWQEIFLKQFLGQSNNAFACELANPLALRYNYNSNTKILKITAVDPLIFLNESTGYMLTTILEEYAVNINTSTSYGEYFVGFKPLTTKSIVTNEVWTNNRKNTYYGSPMHFIRSLFANEWKNESFSIDFFERYYENESLYTQQKSSATNSGEEIIFINEKDFVKRKFIDVKVKVNDTKKMVLKMDESTHKYYFSFDSLILRVGYGKGIMVAPYYSYSQSSFTNLLKAEYPLSLLINNPQEKTFVEANGNYFPESQIVMQGYWRWLRVADVLPLNYYP
jgi:hypothetical protein